VDDSRVGLYAMMNSDQLLCTWRCCVTTSELLLTYSHIWQQITANV